MSKTDKEQSVESSVVETTSTETESQEIALLREQLEKEKAAREKAEKELEKANKKEQKPVTNEEERVRLKLFKDNKDYKDDLVVGLNGKLYQIKRGVEVEVPKGVAEIIEHAAEQDKKTAEMIESLVTETEEKEKSLK